MLIAGLWLSPAVATATLIGDFEGGSRDGWGLRGDVLIVDASFGVTPTQGTGMILLTTLPTDPSIAGSLSGSDAQPRGQRG